MAVGVNTTQLLMLIVLIQQYQYNLIWQYDALPTQVSSIGVL